MDNLVSVIVVTYNSSKFVQETLFSIKEQTYKDIELIITDDCSRDNTVDICREWLKLHGNRFISYRIITNDINTGVSANANRGLYASKGHWLAFTAGDDALKPNCIEDNIGWVSSNEHIRVLFSKVEIYKDVFDPNALIKITPDNPYNPRSIMAPNRSAVSQYKMLLLSDRIHFTPSFFVHRETLISVGGYDGRFRMMEDYPLWLKLTKAGHKLHFMDKITVNYRMHNQAINNKVSTYIINPNYFEQEYFRKVYTYPNLPTDIMLSQRFEWYTSQIFKCERFNKQNKFSKALYSFLTIYMNPFKYIIWLRKRIINNLKYDEFYL